LKVDSTFNFQRSTFNFQLSTFNFQLSTFNVRSTDTPTMPELAEVEFFRTRWDCGLGQRVLRVRLHADNRIFRKTDTAALVRTLTGAALRSSVAHGKQLLFRFSHEAWLGLRFGMTGELRSEGPKFVPGRHEHLVLGQARRSLVFADARQFGLVRFHQGATAPDWWSELSPTVDSPAFTRDRLKELLKRHARAPLKAVLLMQEGFPGIGNWMADEILWRARLSPRLRAGQLDDTDVFALWRAIRLVAAGALRIVAPSFADPPASWLFRHRWEPGGKCPRDGSLLERATVGGRTTVWCGQCQEE
jgi:formamidopyrimidine-DNA glycosylase